jgi:transposase
MHPFIISPYINIFLRHNIIFNSKKIIQDEKLDGIKGFVTNDFTIPTKDVISHYKNQYEVEKAFRISKTDLKIRPIYHRLETRIKAHISRRSKKYMA